MKMSCELEEGRPTSRRSRSPNRYTRAELVEIAAECGVPNAERRNMRSLTLRVRSRSPRPSAPSPKEGPEGDEDEGEASEGEEEVEGGEDEGGKGAEDEEEVPSDDEKKEVETKDEMCETINTLLAEICAEKKREIEDFSPNQNDFLRSIVQQEDAKICYMGYLEYDVTQRADGSYVISDARKNFEFECLKEPYSVILLDVKVGKEDEFVSILFLNNKTNTIEQVEPNISKVRGWMNFLLPEIKRQFKEGYFQTEKYTYIEPSSVYCVGPNKISFKIDEDYLCSSWNLLLAFLKLHCPGMTYEEISTHIGNKSRYYVSNLMQRWLCYMWRYAEEKGIVSGED